MKLFIEMQSSDAAPELFDMVETITERLTGNSRLLYAVDGDSGPIIDRNGNTTGTWRVEV